MTRISSLIPLFAGLLFAASPASAAPRYTVVPLAPLPGTGSSVAHAINDRGQAVGGSGFFTSVQPTLWQADGSAIALGTLPPVVLSERAIGVARDISANGTIAGWSSQFFRPEPVIWEAGQIRRLSFGNVRNLGGEATGVTSSGRVSVNTGEFSRAAGAVIDGAGAVALAGSSADAMNERGDVVGARGGRAVVWRDGVASDLDQGPLNYSRGLGISDGGLVAGVGRVVGIDWLRGILWRDGSTSVLHPLDGLASSDAWGVNDAGLAVGRSIAADAETQRATLWEGGVALDLNMLIAPWDGWTLRGAYDINAAGQIVGVAQQGFGATIGFRLDPIAAAVAAPGMGLLGGVAVLALIAVRRLRTL